MTVSYRNKFTAYKQETDGQYAPVGSIVSVLVDEYSNSTRSPEYGYRNYLYCDGRELNIRDYPYLYRAVGNTYGGSPNVTKTQPTQAGGVTKLYWINGKAFFNLLQDGGISGGLKLPYPYGVNFRIVNDTTRTPPGNGRGALDATNFPYNTFFSTKLPTEDVSAYLPGNNTEYAYEIVFPSSVTATPGSDITFTSNNHPTIEFRKSFSAGDFPFQVGTFKLPDYRDKVIVGYGAVDGEGSPTVENALINNVGRTGGRWFISKNDLLDAGLFFSVGNVRTTGYTNITSDIFTFVTGSVEYTLGPVDDYIFSRPVEHFHYILSSEPDEGLEAEFGSSPSDQYAVLYNKSRANIQPFEPQGANGLALGHSHGITAEPLNDPRLATYGNVAGIGGQDPNVPADVNYDVNDPILTGGASYSGVSLELYGTGSGEIGGFSAPAVTDRGDRYLAFGYGNTGTFGASLQTNRSVTYTMDFTGYQQLYIFAICGNDNNGGERPNNSGEGIQVTIGGVTQEIIPSGQDFNAANGISGNFNAYDAVYAYWTQSFINIPAGNQTAGQTVTISQTCSNSSSGGNELQSGNEGSANAVDMFGIQAIGLRGGIPEDPPDPNGVYPVTGSPLVTISSLVYDSANGYVVATTGAPHGFDSGMIVNVSGAIPTAFNGAVTILPDQLSNINFTYVPLQTPSPTTATGTITARIASGSFSDVTETPPPKVYVINNNTVVGGKPDVFEVPGTGVIFSDDSITSPGTINTTAVASSPGTVFSQVTVNMVAPGGGGAGSFGDGGDAGYAYATFNFKGSNYTIYAYGGDGGTRGNNGGTGGSGGTFLIPAALINDPDFQYSGTNGLSGTTGGSAGSDTATASGGGTDNAFGTGGDGKATSFTTTSTGSWTTYTSSGTWTAPAQEAGETSRTVTIRLAGGGGGGGNSNANSGCSAPAYGGEGNAGALLTATMIQQPTTLSFVIGKGGGAGFNNRDGFIDGTGNESGPSFGGAGASNGGNSGVGAWGNGATAGAGGGSSGVYFNGGTAFLGAGGGGGGGGSGGGFNGGGTTDGCYAGDNARGADTNLHAQDSAIDFNNGGNGSSGSCSAGAGGGGGAGAGPSGIASGGDAGQAGVGHNGNGGGTGGKRGDSTYRTTYATASWSTASNAGGRGSAGGDGYFEVKVDRTILNYGSLGGGGGQGASLNFNLLGSAGNVSISAGLQSAGAGSTTSGDSGVRGENGYLQITYYGSEGGGEITGETTTPAGNYYEANSTGQPGGSLYDGGIWVSSTADGNSETTVLTPVNPGLGTGSSSKFAMPSGTGAPTYGGLATKYLPFTGPGDRDYVLGPLDLTNAIRLRFTMIKGTNLNGGAAPEEGILAYWRVVGSTTTNLLDTVITANDGTSGWGEFNITLPDGSDIRRNNIELILKQTRPAGNDDNDINTEDNYGMSAFTIFYDEVTRREFTPADGQTITDVDFINTTVSATQAGFISTDGFFEMSSSTPISTTALVQPESDISLVTKYHRVKYLIKAL